MEKHRKTNKKRNIYRENGPERKKRRLVKYRG